MKLNWIIRLRNHLFIRHSKFHNDPSKIYCYCLTFFSQKFEGIKYLISLKINNWQVCFQSDLFKVTDEIFFDVEIAGEYLGRIVIGLFGDTVPKTVLNFKQIATNGIDGRTYEGTRFHRVIERFLIQGEQLITNIILIIMFYLSHIQGGDIVYNNGSGSVSIHGKFFKDENFIIKHNGPGIVSMANGGELLNIDLWETLGKQYRMEILI